MTLFSKTAAALMVALLAVSAPALPAAAITNGTPEASVALAKSMGVVRAVFYLKNGKVVSEDWILPNKGWPRQKAHDAIRRIAGTKGAFVKRELKGGNEWLTPKAGITAILSEQATTEAFSVALTEYEYRPGDKLMVYLVGIGLRHQGLLPENVALIKPGMGVDTVAALLGNWDSPTEAQHHDAPDSPMTWNKNGKPAVRVHFKDHKVVRVEKLK